MRFDEDDDTPDYLRDDSGWFISEEAAEVFFRNDIAELQLLERMWAL